MDKKKTKLQIAQEKTEATLKKTNVKIEELGKYTASLYTTLTDIQVLFDKIRNVPSEKQLEYEELKKIRINWKQQVDKIEADYKAAVVKDAGKGVVGVGAGMAVVALGPTAAMGIATTFGVASTGTAISALSGAAATNAALAWLGGGALVAGGGGMAAGNALLAMAGPIGWSIATVAIIGSGLLFWKSKSDKEHLESVFVTISNRDTKSYELAIVELNERIFRIKDEVPKLNGAIERINTFGLDYLNMTEEQQYELGAYVNLMFASTQLLVNPILGLQAKYGEQDFEKYATNIEERKKQNKCIMYKDLIIALSNLLYNIKLEKKDKKLVWKSFRNNKKFLSSLKVPKGKFGYDVMKMVYEALECKYSN